MAIVIAAIPGEPRSPQRFGTMKVAVRALTLDNSYVTGGWSIPATALGLQKITFAIVEERAPGTTKYHYCYNVIGETLKVYTSNGAAPAALAELPNADASQNNKLVRGLFFGY